MQQKAKPDPIVENELFDNETLFWWGKPKPVHMVRGSDMAGVLVGLLVTGFAFFFISTSRGMMTDSSFGGPPDMFVLMFTLFPLIFIAVGLWQASTPLRRLYTATVTYYALTDQRAMVIATGRHTNVQSFYERDIQKVERRSRQDGTGDVVFGTEKVTKRRSSSSGGNRTYTVTIEHGFFGIPDARYVEDMIVQTFIHEDDNKAKRTLDLDNESEWYGG